MQPERTDQDDETVSKAMALIDPSGILVPGTVEYNTIKDMILGWIDEGCPDYALDMARKGAKHLDTWLK
jgi:hypothetical protein